MTCAYYIGIMSGTSLDGVDVTLISSQEKQFKLISNHFSPYPEPIKQQLLVLHQPQQNELENSAIIGNKLAQLYADAVNALLNQSQVSPQQVKAIGCHGQTIRHRPELGFTLQIGNNALLAELTGITVVGDFRSRDIAAGGQGAPLVPAFHLAAFGSNQKTRAIVNIGGIANITYLPKTGEVIGFDSGPGNMLLDYWVKLKLGLDYDANGNWAATGEVIQSFLERMLADPYFALPPPKSTGRDLFNEDWLNEHLILNPNCRPQDVARTLVELTAYSINLAIILHCPNVDEIYLCGGGAHNQLLSNTLEKMLINIPVSNTNALGIDIDWVEAAAFAWLAQQTIDHKPANLPSVTGAEGLRILGAIFPA
jgi:anhydro-N-acetylmuramic acid kinase